MPVILIWHSQDLSESAKSPVRGVNDTLDILTKKKGNVTIIPSKKRNNVEERGKKMNFKKVIAFGLASSMVFGAFPVSAEEMTAADANATTPEAANEETTVTYPDSYSREALEKGLQMTEEEIELTVDAIVNTLLADGDTDCFYTMIAGNNDKTAIQGNPGYATGCPELGVPESFYHDGPAGVTSLYETTGFPVNMSLGSTFSTDLAYAYGQLEGSDNRIIGSNFQLGTQMDVLRTGHWNRTKDTMGEDPYLTGILGAQQVAGVQSEGVAAMIKHYAGYGTNGDTGVNVTIDEQTFHEFYVTSFEYAIKYGNAASVMTTYNSIEIPGFTEENGEFTDSNDYINLDVLREIVGFKGMICCDWGGQKEMSSFQGNTMAMPTAGNNTKENIEAAIEAGEGTFDEIVENVKANLYAYGVAGYLYYSYSNIYYVDGEARVKRDVNRDCADSTTAITLINSYEEDYTEEYMDSANEVVKEIAESGAVLLQNNNNALPLTSEDYTGDNSVAMIGVGATYAFTGTGAERSYGVVNYIDGPYEAMQKIIGEDANVSTYVGLDLAGTTIPEEYIYTSEDGDEHGFVRTYGVVSENSGGMFGPPGAQEEETEEETESDELPEYIPGPDGTGVFASSDIWEMNGLSNESVYVQDISDTKKAYFMVKDQESGEVYELDEVAAIDPVIDFTVGIHADGRRDFENADEEDAVQPGNAITNGEAYTWTGWLEVPESGEYSFILQSIGGDVNCTIDGQTVSSGAGDRQGTQWGWNNLISSREGMGIGTAVTMNLEAGKRYKIEITGIDMPTDLKDMQIRLAWIPAGQAQSDYEAAVQAAKENDKVIFFAYDNTTGNSDGGSAMPGETASDEEVTPASRSLPEDQLQLLRDVIDAAKENGNQVIVVLNTASNIALCDDTYFPEGNGWADEVDSILEMWFGGQAVGTATADLLLGEVSPSGKLPITFHKTGEDTSISYSQEAFNIATGENLDRISNGLADNLKDATVAEGIYIGYRWYDKNDVEPAFDFGHGLSYTTFEYSDLKIEKTADADYGYDVTFTITNTGSVAGAEVAQVYIGEAEVPEGIMSAEIQLCGFDRTEVLEPGESQTITVQVSERSLSYWNALQTEYNENEDGTKDKWTVATGERTIYVGTASDNLTLSETVVVE